MLPKQLKEWTNGPTPEGLEKEEKKMYHRLFWKAQCNMFLLPEGMSPNNSNIETMKKHLSAALRTRQTPPPASLALETSADLQFKQMLERLEHIFSTTRFAPISEGPKEGTKYMDDERPHKRLRQSTSLSRGSTPANLLDAAQDYLFNPLLCICGGTEILRCVRTSTRLHCQALSRFTATIAEIEILQRPIKVDMSPKAKSSRRAVFNQKRNPDDDKAGPSSKRSRAV
ncbi:hypothetical protein RhiLY_04711 [Ceratobasidium sp. AG-Ba]|nr:hypothetical protein RhiLY_04711 [Ceratobasidium sp. AG-Ba]